MKAVVISIAVLFAVSAVTGMTLVYAQRQATMIPANSPTAFLEKKPVDSKKQTIVLLGDSLTHGAVCANYAEKLGEKLAREEPSTFELVNAGINARFAYNAALQIDQVAACEPDFVIVLIGTNDAHSRFMTPKQLARRMEEQSLPQPPDADWYRENLRIIASRLVAETEADVAFLSLPTLGEEPEHPAYRLSEEYSAIVKATAGDYGIAYLPLFETMDSYLRKHPGNPKYEYAETHSLIIRSILQHYVARLSWNRIGEKNGFTLHTDFLHLNDTGAGMVADLVAGFVLDNVR